MSSKIVSDKWSAAARIKVKEPRNTRERDRTNENEFDFEEKMRTNTTTGKIERRCVSQYFVIIREQIFLHDYFRSNPDSLISSAQQKRGWNIARLQ